MRATEHLGKREKFRGRKLWSDFFSELFFCKMENIYICFTEEFLEIIQFMYKYKNMGTLFKNEMPQNFLEG